MHLGQCLNEVHRDVRLYAGRHRQWLEKPRGMQGLRLVPLAGGAGADEVTDGAAVVVKVEGGA